MTTLTTMMTSKQFSVFVSANKKGQLDAAILFALEQINNRNTQYINKLFNLEMLRLVNGSLNKLGTELRNYVQHFKLANLQWQGDKMRWQYLDKEQALIQPLKLITFTAWRDQVVDKKDTAPATEKPVLAKSLLKTFDKLSKTGLGGSLEEMSSVLKALEAAQADVLKSIAALKQAEIDTDKVEQLANLTPSSKERAAPQAVAI